jgi:hypothetical protein
MLGILMLQTRFPRPPGDVGHPASFDFPVRYRVVAGADPARVVRGRDAALVDPFIAAAQRELQAALAPVPVWSSALMALPALPRPGVITIEAASLVAEHFLAVGADSDTPVEGITPGSPLHRTLLEDLPTLDEADAEQQVVAAGQRLLARHPGLQSLVLECTNLPPYAAALRAATGLPVHHIVSWLHERMAEQHAR